MRALIIVATALVCLLGPISLSAVAAAPASDDPTEGQLRAVDATGQLRPPCPLEHTDVDVDVAGLVARVTVTQRFVNPFDETIEAVYLFPLSADAAVDRMTMKIGDRTIAGRIARREEARATYETARAEGRTASLLEQERPNVFTQSVANIPPGARVDVTISYVETLDYEDGRVEFVFPMVVGQRYLPAAAGKVEESMSRLTTSSVKPDTRAGHDVSIEVQIDAGVPVSAVSSKLHAVDTTPKSDHSAVVHLAARDEIPNRDFVLSWDVAGKKLEDAVLAHRDARGGFVTLILQPPDRVAESDLTPKEIVFVVDTSGSMSGLPMEKSKETVRYAIERLNLDDTFNVITFSGSTRVLFQKPVPASAANREAAMKLLSGTQGSGGTEMMSAIRAALDPSDAQHHVRIVCFLTDGYVGNDLEILAEIQKHSNARIFAIGIGNSVNRFLLDQMAAEGRGEIAYATLTDDGEQMAKTFFERVRNPLLTDVTIDWNGLPVTDVIPERIPDVFSAKPVVVAARYGAPASGTIRIRGYAGGREIVRDVAVILPESTAGTDAIATLWARQKVAAVSREDYAGIMEGTPRNAIDERIAALGLEFGLMTPFTSFVAVDDTPVTAGGDPKRVNVATEAPDGTSPGMGEIVDITAGTASAEYASGSGSGEGIGYGTGSGGGVGSGMAAGKSGGAGGDGSVVKSTSYSLHTVVSERESKDLPIVSRNPLTLVTLDGVDNNASSGGGCAVRLDSLEVTAGDAGVSTSDGVVASGGLAETVEVRSGDEAVVSSTESSTVESVEESGEASSSAVETTAPRQRTPLMATGASPAAPWQRTSTRPAVEIVFAIDTTGSMGGLLDGAKRRIWSIVNEIQRTGCRPDVRIGLVAFRDRGDDYETMVLPLTTDLDLVWVTLNGLTPSGGGDTPENVRRALADAVNEMGWTPATSGLSQVIFLVGDAPPQAYADEPDVLDTAAAALRRGIVVHAIQCGEDAVTQSAWTQIASRGAGTYFPIPADSTVAVSLRTPYDAVLADLGRRIGATYTPYGTSAAQEAANERQAGFERSASGRDARAVAADRAVNKAVNSGAYAGDFLQAIENGELKLEDVATSELPKDLRGLSPKALRTEVDRRIAERQNLRAAILDLARLRDTYRERVAANPGDPSAKFDTAVGDAVRKQMRKKGKPCE